MVSVLNNRGGFYFDVVYVWESKSRGSKKTALITNILVMWRK
jgi:hypothetical protein